MPNTTTVLSTSTGSYAQRWYDAWEVTNQGTTTSFYFVRGACPAPRWEAAPTPGNPMRRQLVYDPWTVVSRQVAPYESSVDRVVLVSAEKKWLRGR
jgi:hypothetical protein